MKIRLTSSEDDRPRPKRQNSRSARFARTQLASRFNLHPLTDESIVEYFEFLESLFEPVDLPPPPSTSSLSGKFFATPELNARALGGPEPGIEVRLRPSAPATGQTFITASTERSGFPTALGQFLALHCDLSYQKPVVAGIDNPVPPGHPLLKHRRSFDRDHAQGLGFVFEDHAFLVFRGSESAVDWGRNLKVARKTEGAPGVRVHRGFRQNLDLLWPEIEEWLADLPTFEAVILSGHSLGGAMAILAAHRLRREGRAVRSVITFGSPRVGNKNFASSYADLGLQEKTWRVIWGGDIVTKIPPPIGYCHVGQPEAIGSPRQMEQGQLKGPWSGKSTDLWRTLALILGAKSPWLYATLESLPYVLGLVHSGREHMRALGYSSVHKARMNQQLEKALATLDAEETRERDTIARMHQAYFTGE